MQYALCALCSKQYAVCIAVQRMAYSGKQVLIMIHFAVCGISMHYAMQFNAYNAIAYSGLALGNSTLCIAVQPMAYSGKQVVIMGGWGAA